MPSSLVLAVDLDGTLIRTDMLFETFWATLSKRWTNITAVFGALPDGRANLKRTLEGLGDVDVRMLPYNEQVVDYVQRWRDAGGRSWFPPQTSGSSIASRIIWRFSTRHTARTGG